MTVVVSDCAIYYTNWKGFLVDAFIHLNHATWINLLFTLATSYVLVKFVLAESMVLDREPYMYAWHALIYVTDVVPLPSSKLRVMKNKCTVATKAILIIFPLTNRTNFSAFHWSFNIRVKPSGAQNTDDEHMIHYYIVDWEFLRISWICSDMISTTVYYS